MYETSRRHRRCHSNEWYTAILSNCILKMLLLLVLKVKKSSTVLHTAASAHCITSFGLSENCGDLIKSKDAKVRKWEDGKNLMRNKHENKWIL